MKNLLMNIYGDTIRKICEDLLVQIEDYESFVGKLDESDKKSLTNLKVLIVEPLKVYIEHSTIKGKYDPLYKKYEKYVKKIKTLPKGSKICTNCKGKGFKLENKRIPKRDYPTNLPDSGWVTEEIEVEISCLSCSGKGFLVLKWI